MKFENYSIAREIKENISKLAYKKPTDIQFKAIPPILRGEDVLAIAQTGTGKTAAFAIPVLHLLKYRKLKTYEGVKCLVMAPTHELALQTESVFNELAMNTGIRIFCIHGGVDQDPQKEIINNGVDVLIATPGRMFDLVHQEALNLRFVEILILDEADKMLDLGFIKDIRDLLKLIPRERQTLFFSATINEKIKNLAYSMVKDAIRIQISPKDPVARNINHSLAFIEMEDKRFFLESLINNNANKKILVFVRTKIRAERVKKAMERVGIKADSIHGDKLQKERAGTMDNFRKGDVRILITTDVSARGIDIPDVEFVVNYDLPESSENYIHRVGRTGRGTQKGQAISFCSSEELDLLEMIEKDMGKAITRLEIDKGDYQNTLDFSKESSSDWQSLLREDARNEIKRKKKKYKK